MSDSNQADGRNCYIEDKSGDRDWFKEQWRVWPTRCNPNNTINISFLYGGILAFRELNDGKDPELSKDLKSHVTWLDKN
jgi:hypothetical protein